MSSKNRITVSKLSRILVLLSLSTTLLLLVGCPWHFPKPKTKLNCKTEYERLISKQFCNLTEAMDSTKAFLHYFDSTNQCANCRFNVRQIQEEFSTMENIFIDIDNMNPENRLCTYYQMVRQFNDNFSNSQFETVKKTWECVTRDKEEKYLTDRLNLISKNDFKHYLLDYAVDLAKQKYSSYNVKEAYIINDELSEPFIVDGEAAKRCNCTVHVDLEGMLWGWRQGSVEILVEGTLKINKDSNCSLEFSKGNYNIMKREGVIS